MILELAVKKSVPEIWEQVLQETINFDKNEINISDLESALVRFNIQNKGIKFY